MDKKYSTIRIDAKTFTKEDWEKYFKAKTLYFKHKGKSMPFPSWRELKENTIQLLNKGYGLYIVFNDDESIGYFTFDILLKEEINRRYVYLRDSLIEDLHTELLKVIYSDFMLFDPQSRYVVIKSLNGQYDFLEKKINAEIGDYVEQFELNVTNAKTDIINKWHEVYSEKFKGFELRHYEDIPEDLLEEYCNVFLELLNDTPDESKINDFSNINPQEIKEGQVQGRKQNDCSYRYLVFDDSKLIAKTNVRLNKKNPQRMYQYMTGVTKKYRKSGMGKWLKAVMFLKLTKDFPDLEIITTEIHAKNIASKKLSIQMGYEKTGSKKEYLISRKSIEKFLWDNP